MSEFEDMIKNWQSRVYGADNDGDTATIKEIRWIPKCGWFKPPHWKIFKWAYNIKTVEKKPDEGFSMLHEVWQPRWKHFQPPMLKIFRWAYKIKRTLYTGCYPIGIANTAHHMTMESGIHPVEGISTRQAAKGDNTSTIEVQFQGSPSEIHPTVRRHAESLKTQIDRLFQE